MPSGRLTDEKKRELSELVEGWGKIASERAYGTEGPGLDVDLAALEEVATHMQQALLKGFCEAATQRQADHLPPGLPCPECGRECEVKQPVEPGGNQDPRRMQLRGGSFALKEPRCYCRHCRRSFFPSADGAAD